MVVEAVLADSRAVAQWLAEVRAQGLPMPALLAHLPLGASLAGWWQTHLATPEAIGQIHLPAGGHLGEGRRLVLEVAPPGAGRLHAADPVLPVARW
jgi:glutathione S-transferase